MQIEPSEIHIVQAREPSLAKINALIVRSKTHWDWPEEYLKAALPFHTISPAYLQSNSCFEILDAHGELIGFCSIVVDAARVVIDNLWITPERIGQGIGRQACWHVFRYAQEHGWTDLWVIPDPPAEGFYQKMGFSNTGERVPSRVSGGPMFSVYRIRP